MQLIINFSMFLQEISFFVNKYLLLIYCFPIFLYFLYTATAGTDYTLNEKIEVRQYEDQMTLNKHYVHIGFRWKLQQMTCT